MGAKRTIQAGQIEFQCKCGTHFRVDASLAGRTGSCITCGKSVTIPQASALEPIISERQASVTPAEAWHEEEKREMVSVHALCSICQCPPGDGEETLACPACHLPFHVECWRENLGCSTYGCPQVNVLKKGPNLKVDGLLSQASNAAHDQQVWRCAIGNEFHGPVSAAELVEWMRDKRITTATKVWKSGMAEWLPISSFPELMSSLESRLSTESGASVPWELALLAASAVGFSLALVTYGISSLLALIGTSVFGVMKLRNANVSSWPRKHTVMLLLAFVVSLAGFWTGLIAAKVGVPHL